MKGGTHYCNHPARADGTAPRGILIRGPLQMLPSKIKKPKVPAATRVSEETLPDPVEDEQADRGGQVSPLA
jgi:hypothetical protein